MKKRKKLNWVKLVEKDTQILQKTKHAFDSLQCEGNIFEVNLDCTDTKPTQSIDPGFYATFVEWHLEPVAAKELQDLFKS